MVSGMRRPVVVAMSGVSLVVVAVSLKTSQRPTAVALGSAAVVLTPTPPAKATAAPTRTTTPRASSTRTTAPRPTATRVPRVPRAGATRTAAPTVRHATAAPAVTVNGAAYDTRYGPVQVQITVRSGRITRADAIEYPQGEQRDQEINSYAVPQLDQETLDAQSAHIDTVSGATYTSDGYRQSLQSAIDAAHKAGAL